MRYAISFLGHTYAGLLSVSKDILELKCVLYISNLYLESESRKKCQVRPDKRSFRRQFVAAPYPSRVHNSLVHNFH